MVIGKDSHYGVHKELDHTNSAALWPLPRQYKPELHSHLRGAAASNGRLRASTLSTHKTGMVGKYPDPGSNSASLLSTPAPSPVSCHHQRTGLLLVQYPESESPGAVSAGQSRLMDSCSESDWSTASTPHLAPHQRTGLVHVRQYPGIVWRQQQQQQQQQDRIGGPEQWKYFRSSNPNVLLQGAAAGSCRTNALLSPPAFGDPRSPGSRVFPMAGPSAGNFAAPPRGEGFASNAELRPRPRDHSAYAAGASLGGAEARIDNSGLFFRLRDAPSPAAAAPVRPPDGSGVVFRSAPRNKPGSSYAQERSNSSGLFFRPLLRNQSLLISAGHGVKEDDDDDDDEGADTLRPLGVDGPGSRLRKAKPSQVVVQKRGLPWKKTLIRACCLRKTRRRRVRSIVNLYRKMPLKAISRLWGRFNQVELPVFLRRPLLSLYIWMFGCRLDEAEIEDLRHYKNLGEFFRRELKPHVRPIDDDHVLTSPADGKILYYGKVENGILEQVKGVTYSLRGFLGPQTWHGAQASDINHMSDNDYQEQLGVHPDNDLFHCIIYLAPGDYHRFHSPTHWNVYHRRHFPGELLSVNPGVARWIQGLFNFNERAVYTGKWEHGFFSMCAVGATNVGSIKIYCDEDLETNTHHKHQDGTYFDRTFSSAVDVTKGSMFGEFNLGSTLVLIFEAPKGFDFKIHEGQKVRYGEPLGTSL